MASKIYYPGGSITVTEESCDAVLFMLINGVKQLSEKAIDGYVKAFNASPNAAKSLQSRRALSAKSIAVQGEDVVKEAGAKSILQIECYENPCAEIPKEPIVREGEKETLV